MIQGLGYLALESKTHDPNHLYLDSKPFVTVICFAKLVQTGYWGVSSVPFPSRFPFQLQCELVSSLLALDATELVSQPLTQMVVEMINIHVISVLQKR